MTDIMRVFKTGWAFALAVLLLWGTAGTAMAFGYGEERRLAAEILPMLDQALAVRDGRVTAKPVYIFFNVNDPLAQSLFEKSRELAQLAEIRWVPVGGAGAGRVAVSRRGQDLVAAFRAAQSGQQRGAESRSVVEERALLNNRLILRHFAEALNFRQDSVFPLPIFAFAEEGALVIRVAHLETGNPAPLASRITPRETPYVEPAALRYLNGVSMPEIAPKPFIPPRGGVDVWLFPDPAALRLMRLSDRESLTISAETASGWFRVDNMIEGQPGYIFAPDYGDEMPLYLEQRIQSLEPRPFYAKQGTRIRVAPDHSARVLAQLAPGEGYVVTGMAEIERESWYRIELWENGGTAWLPAGDVAP